jgi:hypothetical protein
MRQFSTCTSRRVRLAVVFAAVSLITLAASIPIYSADSGGHSTDQAAGTPGTVTASTLTTGPLEYALFVSPNRVGVWCEMFDQPGDAHVRCQSTKVKRRHSNHPRSYNQKVTLRGNGDVWICQKLGGAGGCKLYCFCDDTLDVSTLHYGTQITFGRFSCRSIRYAIKCVLIESGEGFRINKNRVVRVGP